MIWYFWTKIKKDSGGGKWEKNKIPSVLKWHHKILLAKDLAKDRELGHFALFSSTFNTGGKGAK